MLDLEALLRLEWASVSWFNDRMIGVCPLCGGTYVDLVSRGHVVQKAGHRSECKLDREIKQLEYNRKMGTPGPLAGGGGSE